MFYKIIFLMLFCTFEASAITSKTIVYVFEILSKAITSTLNAISNWINKPRMQYTKKQRKTSNGSGKFLKIFAQARSLAIMNKTVNLEDMVVGTHSWKTNCEQNVLQRIIWTQI